MEIRETSCQIRRDIRGRDIPEAILQQERFRRRFAEIVGKSAAEIESVDREDRLPSAGPATSEALRALRNRFRSRVSVKNGFFQESQAAAAPGFIVEDLTVDEDTLYVQGLASTEQCRLVLNKVIEALREYGVPAGTLDSYEESYATETIARLDGRIDSLFAPSFVKFAEERVPEAAGRDEHTRVVVHPFLVRLKVNRWRLNAATPQEAAPDRWDVELSHESFRDHDEGVFKFYTRFDYDKHVELLRHLESCLQSKPCNETAKRQPPSQ